MTEIDDPVVWEPRTNEAICSILDKGKKIGSGKAGNVFRVKINSDYYVVKISRHTEFKRDLRSDPPSSIYVDALPKTLVDCLTKGPLPEQYLGLDEFSNEAIIAYMIDVTAQEYKLPKFFLIHNDAVVCNKGLIHLMEEAELGTLAQFGYTPYTNKYLRSMMYKDLELLLVPPKLLIEMLKQIVVFLIFSGQTLGFSSGDLKAANVFVAGESVKYEHKDELYHIKIDCPFIVKIGDYGKSSITIPILYDGEYTETRIYNKNIAAEYYSKVSTPVLSLKVIENGYRVNANYMYEHGMDLEYGYVIEPTFTESVFVYNRHMGTPYYRSLDFYTLIVSLLVLPQFKATLLSPELRKFWDVLWVNGEGDKVYTRSGKSDLSRVSIHDSLPVLKGLTLKCNVVELAAKALSEDY